MKKSYRLLILCLITATLRTFGQSKSIPLENSLLWEISGNGLAKPSYLFGTYHFIGKNVIDSLHVVKRDFDQCKIVVGEFLPDSIAINKLASAMVFRNNSLDLIFTANEYKLIGDYYKEITTMNIQSSRLFKPAALEIELSYFTPRNITSANPALDYYFLEEGKRRGKRVLGIETAEDRIDLLLNAPIAEQKNHLLNLVRKKDRRQQLIDTIYELYRRQDLYNIGKKLISDAGYSPVRMDKMIKVRNLKWAQRLPSIMNQQSAFIALGAEYMVGEYGLINQLRLKGYTVKPVMN